MKKSLHFFVFLFSGIGLIVSFRSSTNEIKISLNEAIQKGYVKCKTSSNGSFSGSCVKLHLQNNTVRPFQLLIPPGTLFYPSDSEEQTLITVEPQMISLAPSSVKTENVNAYCSEHSDQCPSEGGSFTIGSNKNPKFDSLFVFLKNNVLPSSQQAIVWAISDNSPVSSISTDSKKLRDIRSFLFKLTGQDEVNYAIEMSTIVNDLGFIDQKPIQLKGFVNFDVQQSKWIHQEVYDENGKMKFKSNQAFEIPKGTSDYAFNIGLKNWESGKYILKLKAGSEVIETYPFKV